ncbi:MAG: membrane protein insertion efficiency factor YidD [Oscillospiraceae bacterium]|nr:membrane protein insertion efficiency factor YidD [Oscillospiraceae bacterium]
MITKLLIFPIRLYKKFLSPMLGNHCRFYPTCSEYAMQALEIHGPLLGILLATWRILRCNPFGKGGVDKVPQKGQWKKAFSGSK